MIGRRNSANLGQLQTLYNVGTIGDLTDGQLLERFATDADEVAELAFSALVERHQALVWRVCLAIVRDEHEAEDAFQATFLVLVRKARTLWVRDSLGPWLHQVACRTASCLRTNVMRRRKHEQRCAEKDAARSAAVEIRRDLDLDAAIHEELNRLPEKYRAPLVLCDMEGRTHQEAARFLGWPIGTVKSRQSQGRGRIRDRLARRGMGLAVAGAIVESLRQTAIAALPVEVSRNAAQAAMRQSARMVTGFEVSARVLTLTQGVLRAMLWVRLRFLTAATVAVGIASVAASAYVSGSQEPASNEGQPVSKPSTTETKQAPQPKGLGKAIEPPKPDTPELDLRAQRLATRKAKAVYEIAKLTHEIAEIAVEEYKEVDYPRDLATVEGEIKLAKAELTRAADRLEQTKRRKEKGSVSDAQYVADKVAHQQKVFALEQAQTKLDVLLKFTKGKTIKELQSEVENARADEKAKEAAWNLERAKEAKLEPQSRRRTH